MLRLILILIVGTFVAFGVLAVVLYHFLGIKGLIAFPFVVLGFVWAAKWLIKNLVKKVALSLFGMKARALRGATMNVHSIRAVPEPPESKSDPDPPSQGYGAASDEDEDEDDAPPALGPGATSEENSEPGDQPAVVTVEEKDPKDYVELDVTITPGPDGANRVWEPTEFILASEKIRSMADLYEKTIGNVHSVEIWNGTAFGPDDGDKYPGEQRLKIVFEVKQGSKYGWLCYYQEPIGQLELPMGIIEV